MTKEGWDKAMHPFFLYTLIVITEKNSEPDLLWSDFPYRRLKFDCVKKKDRERVDNPNTLAIKRDEENTPN